MALNSETRTVPRPLGTPRIAGGQGALRQPLAVKTEAGEVPADSHARLPRAQVLLVPLQLPGPCVRAPGDGGGLHAGLSMCWAGFRGEERGHAGDGACGPCTLWGGSSPPLKTSICAAVPAPRDPRREQ